MDLAATAYMLRLQYISQDIADQDRAPRSGQSRLIWAGVVLAAFAVTLYVLVGVFCTRSQRDAPLIPGLSPERRGSISADSG